MSNWGVYRRRHHSARPNSKVQTHFIKQRSESVPCLGIFERSLDVWRSTEGPIILQDHQMSQDHFHRVSWIIKYWTFLILIWNIWWSGSMDDPVSWLSDIQRPFKYAQTGNCLWSLFKKMGLNFWSWSGIVMSSFVDNSRGIMRRTFEWAQGFDHFSAKTWKNQKI
jgi:hypothetical protein